MRRVIKISVGILLLAGVLFGFWKVTNYFLSQLSAASPTVSAAVIGGMSTAFVGIAAAFLAHRSARIRASDEAHRVKKVEIYRDFLEIVGRLMATKNDKVSSEPLKEGELVKFLMNFKSDIMLWGAPSVINAFRKFNAQSKNGSIEMFKAMDDLYRAIRSDIGLSNRGLEPYALVKMYLNDPSELDALTRANKSLKLDIGEVGAA